MDKRFYGTSFEMEEITRPQLHVEKGAEIHFSDTFAHYLPPVSGSSILRLTM